MGENLQVNADRFMGFADLYDSVRPKCPKRVKEIILNSNTELCDARRFIAIALSQGGLQSILKFNKDEISPYLISIEKRILDILGEDKFEIDFCYRMGIAVK